MAPYSDQWLKIFTTAFSKGATQPTGTVAIIDVFGAFTTAVVALANEDSAIVMVRSVGSVGVATRKVLGSR
jgi:phosphosulfolactate phosphohydrolase-like enzyme